MGSRKYYFLIFLLAPILVSVSLVDEAFAPYHQQSQQSMSVSTDKPSYDFGDILTINGQGAESYSISIIILSPSGKEITEISTFKTSAGEFSTIWIIPSGIEKGMYTIKARDSTQTAQATFSLGKLEVKPQSEQSQSKAIIPDWIRNNAKWWSEGQIEDSDFVSGIQFMIKENIMVIPDLQEDAQKMELKDEKRAMGLDRDKNVPDWVRNNAGWWSQGLISDDDFVNGIQYMVRVGIIVVKTMNLTSDAFENDGMIPTEYTCDGDDVSPQLTTSNVPKNAKSLALIMDDPDAPVGTFVHWVIWNISPDKNTISKGESLSEPEGKTDFGRTGYGGPCPPSGTHRYFFKLYALDTMLEIGSDSTKQELETVMQVHIIEQTALMGKYSRN